MEIKYDVYWKTDKGNLRITHGVLTEDDLVEAAKRKEDRERLDSIPVEVDSVIWDEVKL